WFRAAYATRSSSGMSLPLDDAHRVGQLDRVALEEPLIDRVQEVLLCGPGGHRAGRMLAGEVKAVEFPQVGGAVERHCCGTVSRPCHAGGPKVSLPGRRFRRGQETRTEQCQSIALAPLLARPALLSLLVRSCRPAQDFPQIQSRAPKPFTCTGVTQRGRPCPPFCALTIW